MGHNMFQLRICRCCASDVGPNGLVRMWNLPDLSLEIFKLWKQLIKFSLVLCYAFYMD